MPGSRRRPGVLGLLVGLGETADESGYVAAACDVDSDGVACLPVVVCL